ncbi:MAG: hypothetical protein ACRDCC_08300 [Culicoidibacterales bacterium]
MATNSRNQNFFEKLIGLLKNTQPLEQKENEKTKTINPEYTETVVDVSVNETQPQLFPEVARYLEKNAIGNEAIYHSPDDNSIFIVKNVRNDGIYETYVEEMNVSDGSIYSTEVFESDTHFESFKQTEGANQRTFTICYEGKYFQSGLDADDIWDIYEKKERMEQAKLTTEMIAKIEEDLKKNAIGNEAMYHSPDDDSVFVVKNVIRDGRYETTVEEMDISNGSVYSTEVFGSSTHFQPFEKEDFVNQRIFNTCYEGKHFQSGINITPKNQINKNEDICDFCDVTEAEIKNHSKKQDSERC